MDWAFSAYTEVVCSCKPTYLDSACCFNSADCTETNQLSQAKTGSHSPSTYLGRSRRLQLTTVGEVPGASAMGRRCNQICANTNWIRAISTIPPLKMDRMVFLEYFASADDVHIKYFQRWQPPACRDKPVINPGTDYDSAMNVHIWCNGVPATPTACRRQLEIQALQRFQNKPATGAFSSNME